MSHYVGDDVAPTVDSSGGGIGHILNIRFSYSSLLPMPANFRLSPPPFSRCADLSTDPVGRSIRIAAAADAVSSFQGIIHRLPTEQQGLSFLPHHKQLLFFSLVFPMSLQLRFHH